MASNSDNEFGSFGQTDSNQFLKSCVDLDVKLLHISDPVKIAFAEKFGIFQHIMTQCENVTISKAPESGSSCSGIVIYADSSKMKDVEKALQNEMDNISYVCPALSNFAREMLKKPDVMKNLEVELEAVKCLLTIEREKVKVYGHNNNKFKGVEIVKNVICPIQFEATNVVNDFLWDQEIEQLRKQHGDRFEVVSMKTTASIIVCAVKDILTDLDQSIRKFLDEHTIISRSIDIQSDANNYLLLKMSEIVRKLRLPLPLIHYQIDHHQGFIVKGSDQMIADTEKEIKDIASRVVSKNHHLTCPDSCFEYLKSTDGCNLLKQIGRDHDCHIEVKEPCHTFSNPSPKDLFVPDSISWINVDNREITVMPFNCDQIACDAMLVVGGQPMDQSQLDNGGKRIKSPLLLMNVKYECPDHVADQDYWGNTVRMAMMATEKEKLTSLCFFLPSSKVTPILPNESISIIIDIVDQYWVKNPSSSIRTFMIGGDVKNMMVDFRTKVNGKGGKITEIPGNMKTYSLTGSSIKVSIIKESLEKHTADVIVNTTNSMLDLTVGAVSWALLEAAGPGLGKECKAMNADIQLYDFVSTEGHNLKCKHIFHAVLPSWDQSNNQKFDRFIKKCLYEANAMAAASIAFPALGTGNLRYPVEEVAKAIWNAASEAGRDKKISALTKVDVVLFPGHGNIIQTFVEVFDWYADIVRDIFKIGKVIVEVVEDHDDMKLDNWNLEITQTYPGSKQHKVKFSKRDYEEKFINVNSRDNEKVFLGCLQWAESYSVDSLSITIQQITKLFGSASAVHDFIRILLSYPNHRKLTIIGDKSGAIDFIKKMRFELSTMDRALSKARKAGNNSLTTVTMAVTSDSYDKIRRATRDLDEHLLQKQFNIVFPPKDEDTVDSNEKTASMSGQSSLEAATTSEKKLHDQTPAENCCLVVESTGVQDHTTEALRKAIPNIKHIIVFESEIDADQAFNQKPNSKFTLKRPDQQPLQNLTAYVNPNFLSIKDNEGIDMLKAKSGVTLKVNERTRSLEFSGNWIQIQNAVAHLQRTSAAVPEQTIDDLPVVHVLSNLEYMCIRHFHRGEVETLEKDHEVAFKPCVGNNIEVKSASEHFDPVTTSCTKWRKEVQDMIKEVIEPAEHERPSKEKLNDVARQCPDVYFHRMIEQIILCGTNNQDVLRAKHLLLVAIGRKTQTDRKGRWAAKPAAPTRQHTLPHDVMRFKITSGLQILVYKTDITKVTLDVIVNAANERLMHGGGVAGAISRAAGPSLQQECYDYVNRNGMVSVSDNCVTNPGNLPCKLVIHAVGPRWADYYDKTECEDCLRDTIINCLARATEMKMSTIAIPAISANIFGVPSDICARAYASAVDGFVNLSRQRGALTLKEVHFVDIDSTILTNIQTTFQRFFSDAPETNTQPSVTNSDTIKDTNNQGSYSQVTATPSHTGADTKDPGEIQDLSNASSSSESKSQHAKKSSNKGSSRTYSEVTAAPPHTGVDTANSAQSSASSITSSSSSETSSKRSGRWGKPEAQPEGDTSQLGHRSCETSGSTDHKPESNRGQDTAIPPHTDADPSNPTDMKKSSVPPDSVKKSSARRSREDLTVDNKALLNNEGQMFGKSESTNQKSVNDHSQEVHHKHRSEHEVSTRSKNDGKGTAGQTSQSVFYDKISGKKYVPNPQNSKRRIAAFQLSADLAVMVYNGDITKATLDAVVSIEDTSMSCSRGIAKALMKKGGSKYKKEHSRCKPIGTHYLKEDHILITTGGDLPCQNVMHVITNCQDVMKCKHVFLRIIEKATKWNYKTITLPLFGEGVATDVTQYAKCLREVVVDIVPHTKSSLSEIHLITNDKQPLVDAICQEFDKYVIEADRMLQQNSSSRSSSSSVVSANRDEGNAGSRRSQDQQGATGNNEDGVSESRRNILCSVCNEAAATGTRKACGHHLCQVCLSQFTGVPGCQTCQRPTFKPPGKMTLETSYESLRGYEQFGTIKITYNIPGTQITALRQQPMTVRSFYHSAFIPDCDDGRLLMILLAVAFSQGRTFNLDQGKYEYLLTTIVEHKLYKYGSEKCSGYPDSKYIQRAMAQLASMGITDKNVGDVLSGDVIDRTRYLKL